MNRAHREAGTSARVLLNEVRSDLEDEDRDAIRRAKHWILFRLWVILAVILYMNWISGPLARMTPEELTRVASVRLEQRLPEARGRLRDYALSEASAASRQAHSLLIEVPTHLRTGVESRLLASTDALIRDFEMEIVAWLVDEVPVSVDLEPPDRATIEGWYKASTAGSQSLDSYLGHLQRGEALSAAESLDRKLIEAWVALIQRRNESPDHGRLEQARRDS